MLIERLQFFNGQRLLASDLQSIDDFNREMRWLHNQSLHQPGVGSGYAVSGLKGDRQVTIQPGYALDSLGREIVLTETQILAVPPVANDGYGNSVFFDLTVSYPQDTDLVETETREGVCVSAGAVRLRESPVFCWMRLPVTTDVQKSLDTGARIRLARVEVFNCQLNQPISLAERRNARPATRPYVAGGATDTSGWGKPTASAFGVEVIYPVDTTSGCFRTAPCYTARIAGDRHFTFEINGTSMDFWLDGFVSITEPTVDGFNALVLIPAILMELRNTSLAVQVAKDLAAKLVQNNWTVEWVGVEG